MEASCVQHRLLAILAADAVGYSRLMSEDDEGTFSALEEARVLFRASAQAHGGRVADTAGDSIVAAFDTATGAVQAAEQVQLRVAAAIGSSTRPRLAFRVGVHLGDVIVQPDGTLYGEGVNVAARLQALADAGGVLVSDAVRAAVRPEITGRLTDRGEHAVKNIPRPVRAYALEPAAFGRVGPGLSTGSGRFVRRCITGAVGLIVALGSGWFVARTYFREPRQVERVTPSDRAPVAVLPFQGAPGASEATVFGRGVAEDLSAALARNSDMRVVLPLAASIAAQEHPDGAAAASALGIRYFVDGSVAVIGDRLRVTVRLNDADEHRIIWSEQQDIDAAGLASARDGFVRRVAMELHSNLRSFEVERVQRRSPARLDVYEKTMRAVALKHQLTPESMASARGLLEEVVRQDPQYAPGWAYLAMVNAIDRTLGLSDVSHLPDIRDIQAELNRAVLLDPDLPAAHFARAMMLAQIGRLEDGLAAVDTCLANAPSDADCLIYRVNLLARLGRYEEALRELDAQMALVPVRPAYMDGWIASAQVGGRRYKDALLTTDRCLSRLPSHAFCHVSRLVALVESGRTNEARAAAAETRQQVPPERLQAAVRLMGPGPTGARAIDALEASGIQLDRR